MMNIVNAILICIISKQFSASEPEYDMFGAIKNYGYPVETHEVLTEDGYLLTLYRIPHGQHSTGNRTNEYPVLVHHGMATSSDCFVILGPEKSLGFVLADNGYDVWMLNARGSWHSRKHTSLDPDKDRSFWQYSWHEIGVYDIPATIDYVLGVTRKRDLHYVGHSQGTTTIFVMASERPDYNSKLKVVIAMAPAAVFKNVKNPLFLMIAPFTDLWKALADYLEIYELPPPNVISARQMRVISSDMCAQSSSFAILCQILVNVFQNGGNSLLDTSMVAALSKIAIAAVSTKQFLHYSQLVNSGNFEQYDFGTKHNLQKYNSKRPPPYNFTNIKFPAALFYAEADNFVDGQDVLLLNELLPNVVDFYKVPYKTFGHFNFVASKNIDILVNKEMLKVMSRYQN